jgi:tRNA dimethylallyltransferase
VKNSAFMIVGPTGTGKSTLALELAVLEKLPIINVDSMQVYKDLVVGSAQPSKEDFQAAKHYLYGYLEAGESLTAAQYSEDVVHLMNGELRESPLIFCGGSGFYIQAIEKGMYDVPTLTNAQKEEVLNQLESWGWEEAYKKLLEKDPSLSKKIHGNDHYRIGRAWEIIITTGKTPSEIETSNRPAPLQEKKLLKVAIDTDKDFLRQRIFRRAHEMLKNGWIEEVERLIDRGHESWAALRSVGYSEIYAHIKKPESRDDLVEKIVIANMQLIKKQRTWFQRDKEIQWFDINDLSRAVEYCQVAMNTNDPAGVR